MFSTKKASVLLLDNNILDSIENSTLAPDDEATLSKLGIIIPDRESEKLEMYNMLDMLNSKNTGLNISVIINLDCNFECVYCYEGDQKGRHYMSEDTIGLLINFIKSNFSLGKKSINIDFYGGEPLLSTGLIKSISGEVKSFAEGRGADYTFTLVSNGSLFRRQIAEELKQLGLTGVRITLDGTAEAHNKYRPFKSGADSFDTIIRNIKETCDIVKISTGGNFDRGNFETFPQLFDYFIKEGLTPERIYEIRTGPVSKRPEDDNTPTDYSDWCLTINEPWIIKAGEMLREAILKRGYHTTKIMPMPCQVEIADAYVVNYDGAIYKCPALIGRDGFKIGILRDGVTDYTASHKLGIWKNKECIECEYLPLCFGGCRYMAYVRDGNIDKPDCKKPFFEASLETMIKQDIKYRKPLKAK
ncbi:MAG: geopeptide radical SAM maturase, partial [Methanothrix sp.]|nr:geopeptide radical SAM maturase [Methanothrix sp.]